MRLIEFIKRNREAFLDRHSDAGNWAARLFSGATYSLWSTCRPIMIQNCFGLVLDAGSGRGTWRRTILQSAVVYESIDIAARGGATPTWTGDISAMPQVPAARYDTVVCHQVLEHVRQPSRAVAEFHRVLKPGGTIVLSVPHISRRHELPRDYFRFTQEGLIALLEDAGYVDIDARPFGGLFAFLHHQISFLFPGLVTGIPVLGAIAIFINAPFSWLVTQMDRALDRSALIPLGVVATARKPL
jgi:SAM-dependent methyltransferase